MKTAQFLQKKVINLKLKLEKKDNELKKQSRYIKTLEAALIDLKKHRFGKRSEKTDPDQMSLFNEAELLDDKQKKTPKPSSGKKNIGKRKKFPKDIPSVDEVHDLPEDEKTCPHDGTALKFIGKTTSQEIKFIPAKQLVINHVQFKYSCPCCNKYVVLAKKPKKLIPKSISTPELLSYISTSKYADGLPLYRLSTMFKRLGISISRQVMANWMIKCSTAIQPLVNLIQDEIYKQDCVHIDESPIQVLKEEGKKASSKSYMWVQKAGDNILFNYHPTRSAQVVEQLLATYKGAIMTDGYKAYDDMAIKYMIIHLACWVHARRYFKKVLDIGKNPNAKKMLRLIAKLYIIESRIKKCDADEIYRQRQKYSKPILAEIRKFLDDILHNTTPSGKMGEALRYLHNQWHKLIRYIEDGNYPIDNNEAENAFRPFVIGRKNWLFANTPSGAQASANLYSIVETAKAHGIDPQRYLTHIYKQLPLVQSVADYEKLLPWNYKSSQ